MKYYLLNWEEKEIRCRGSETGWRDWIIRQFKERIGEVTGANHSFWKKIRIHCFLM